MLLYQLYNTVTGQVEYHSYNWKQEIPTGTVNGTNTQFTLSKTPVSADSTLVFVDGLPVVTADWVLDINNKRVTFNTAPYLGQLIYVMYLALRA